jgi:hypothetical protein
MRRGSLSLCVVPLVVGVVMAAACPAALGQKPQPSEAESLFNTARDLMSQQRFADACPMLSRSNQLMPAVGTALNLGVCSERLGRTASAMLAYKEAVDMAEQMGPSEKKRVQMARDRVTALEPKLVRLRIAIDHANPSSIRVKRDGIAMETAQLDAPVPVDPDDHLIEASAPGKVPWQAKVNVATEGGTVVVTVPELADLAAPATAAATASTPGATTMGDTSAAPKPAASGGTGRTIAEVGLVLLGVGGLAAGTVLALGAKSEYDDAHSLCDATSCAPQAQTIQHSAAVRGNIATVFFIVSGAALAGAGVLWLTAPSSKPASGSSRVPAIGIGPQGILVRGSF